MLFPKRQDWKNLTTSGALGTSYSMELTREYWLESLWIKLAFTTPATVTTLSANGIVNMLKRVRLSINDASGNRKAVDCTGMGLINYWRNVVGSVDRLTAATLPGTGGVGATSTAYTIWFPVPIRHPQLDDPYGAATMIPLPRLSSNAVLDIDIASASDASYQGVAATYASVTSFSIDVLVNRRDVVTKTPFPYIPGELITYEKNWASSGKGDWEIPSGGTVTGITQEDYTSVTARGSVLATAATDDWSLEYLSQIMRRAKPDAILAENEATVDLYPATWNNPSGCIHWDFLTDFSGASAFNLGSGLDLNPQVVSGGKARIIGSNITGGANVRSLFTVHKLFGDLSKVQFV